MFLSHQSGFSVAKLCSSQIPFYFAIGDPFADIVDQDQKLKSAGLHDYVYIKAKQGFPR